MGEETARVGVAAARPAEGDRTAWRLYWQAQGQAWRTEPEIGTDRQTELTRHRAIAPSIRDNRYPLAGLALARADVEWLLATHEGGAGPVDWSDETQRGRDGLDLRGALLREVDLRGLPLARLRAGIAGATPEQVARAAAHLQDADLRGAHLEGADLRGAELAGADLRKALLASADLRDLQLAQTDLREADLTHADLRGALAEGANLEEARLEDARLAGARLNGARLRQARLARASLDQAQLEGAVLLRADLAGATLRDAQLSHTNLHEAHLEGSVLRAARLVEADLRAARLDGADLLRADLRGANLEAAALHGALLLGVHLEGANLYGVRLDGKRTSAGDLPPADLRGAFMDSATNLRNATLGDDTLGYVSLADVTWGGANLAVVRWPRRGVLSGGRLTRHEALGDERAARRPGLRDGTRKTREQWIAGYEAAVRANRQLAVALRAQGLDEAAARFAYRAQVLQRQVQRRQGQLGSYGFAVFLDLLAGYGYRPGRSVVAYLIVILGFAAAYLALGHGDPIHLSPLGALVFSITSFHGRGFFPGGLALDDPLTVLAACEAIIGLVIEISFIATFTQRFFGK